MNRFKITQVLMAIFTVAISNENIIRIPLSRNIGEQPITKTQKLLTDFHEERRQAGIKLE